MSPLTAIRYQYEAYRDSGKLLKQRAEVGQLERELAANIASPAKKRRIEAEIARLNKSMEANSTYEAYEQGLMPTIVEDVSADIQYANTMRGDFLRKVSEGIDNKLSFTPTWVRDGLKFAAGSPDSEIYQFLNNMVMQSDFVARQAILRHWKEQRPEAKPGTAAYDDMIGEVKNYSLTSLHLHHVVYSMVTISVCYGLLSTCFELTVQWLELSSRTLPQLLWLLLVATSLVYRVQVV